MADQKTKPTDSSVETHLSSITDAGRQADMRALVQHVTAWTGFEPVLWGGSIIGFGQYHYRYDSGHEGDAPLTAIASRAKAITVYLAPDPELKDDFLQRLGKGKMGKGCLYINRLSDINTDVLREAVEQTVELLRNRYAR